MILRYCKGRDKHKRTKKKNKNTSVLVTKQSFRKKAPAEFARRGKILH